MCNFKYVDQMPTMNHSGRLDFSRGTERSEYNNSKQLFDRVKAQKH